MKHMKWLATITCYWLSILQFAPRYHIFTLYLSGVWDGYHCDDFVFSYGSYTITTEEIIIHLHSPRTTNWNHHTLLITNILNTLT